MKFDPIDTSFYTKFRYEGTPEDTINEFADSLALLLKRLASDLRSTSAGRFGLDSNDENEAMAVAVDRSMPKVDLFRSLALGTDLPQEAAIPVRNTVANVLADSNATGTTQARTRAPKAREAKFDQGKTGSAVDGMKDYATKIKDATAAIGKFIEVTEVLDPIGKLIEAIGLTIAAMLEDIAILGAKPADNTGGNEATRQIEDKLDYVIPIAEGIQTGQDRQGKTIDGIDANTRQINTRTEKIEREVDTIEFKAEILGRLLGKTLVGEEWDVRPRTVDKSKGLGGIGKIPEISVKDEMHGIENNIDQIIRIQNNQQKVIVNINLILIAIIQFIINIFPTQFFFFFQKVTKIKNLKQPKGLKPLIDERLKKIYVFEEGPFTPRSATERKTVDVKTAAFDVSGWIDLTSLRAGDVFEVATFVTVAGKRRRLAQTRFDQAALIPFADFARGLNYVSGNQVRIQMRQAVSADSFRTKLNFGYQFVVESQ
jgi:hypothetical protein